MRYLILLTLGVAASGCFPYHYTARPGLVGNVVSDETRKPIAGAAVGFVRGKHHDIVYSQGDGAFSMPVEKEWGIWIVPQDVFNRRDKVLVQKDGYKAQEVEVVWNPSQRAKQATKQLGTIALTSASQ